MAGRNAEGHHVGEAVVLLAERAFGVGPARHAAVQAVEEHGDEHRDAGVLESQVDGRHDGVEAGEQCPGGEQVRQPVHSARPCCASRRRRSLAAMIPGGLM